MAGDWAWHNLAHGTFVNPLQPTTTQRGSVDGHPLSLTSQPAPLTCSDLVEAGRHSQLLSPSATGEGGWSCHGDRSLMADGNHPKIQAPKKISSSMPVPRRQTTRMQCNDRKDMKGFIFAFLSQELPV
uniref:Uncharacterized protein n=1 Tax=Panagrellus redivivus TaxID=6233 RepID=A0A7E4V1F4_PANRE